MPVKKKLKKKKIVKPKPIVGRHYDRVVMDDIISTKEHTTNLYGQAMGVDYRKMYEDLKKDLAFDRQKNINDLMRSVAIINESLSRIIGEIGGGRL